MIKVCVDCQKEFEVEPEKAWAKRCLPCWKKDKQKDQVWQLQQENRVLRDEILQLRNLPPQIITRSGGAPDGFNEMIRTLIQLCHPDKHEGSVASVRATQWLLKQR